MFDKIDSQLLFIFLSLFIWRYRLWIEGLLLWVGFQILTYKMVNPPKFQLPQFVVMLTGFILVWRRGGRLCQHTIKSFFLQIVLSSVTSYLDLKIVWEPAAKITFAILKELPYLVEAVFEMSITSEEVHYLQFLTTLLLPTLLLCWLLYTVATTQFICRCSICTSRECKRLISLCQKRWVRFSSTVEMGSGNPTNCLSERQTSRPLVAPQRGERNPVWFN